MKNLTLITFLLLSIIIGCNENQTNTNLIVEEYDDSDTIKYTEYHFPLVIYTSDSTQLDGDYYLNHTMEKLNEAFSPIDFVFEVDTVLYYDFPDVDVLQNMAYDEYLYHSKYTDFDSILSLWIVPVNDNFCTITDNMISCSRTGGWSFINNPLTNNVVITNFDLANHWITIHEVGHFFGLYHTFEKHKYGVEDSLDCENTGDRICDTPYDPNLDIYVKYGTCELIGYNTLVNNYMSYYGLCYNKDKEFTDEQYQKMFTVGVEDKSRFYIELEY